MDPKDAYTALWLDIVDTRSNVPSRLADAAKAIDMTRWPAPIVRLYLGRLAPEAVLAAADDPDAKTKNGRLCDVNFYSGELALRRGDKSEAMRLFRLAAADCPKYVGQYIGTIAELKVLDAGGGTMSQSSVPPAGVDCSAAEAHWKSVEALAIAAAYEDHFKRFPNCAFAGLAKMKLEALKK